MKVRKKERESEYQGRRKVIKSVGGGGQIGSNGGGANWIKSRGGTDRPKVVCPHQF